MPAKNPNTKKKKTGFVDKLAPSIERNIQPAVPPDLSFCSEFYTIPVKIV